MLRIALVAVGACIVALMLRQIKSEFAIFVPLCAGIIVAACCIARIEMIAQLLERLQKLTEIKSEYISILLKMAGIAYIAEITSGICKDCGYNAIAGQVEMFGKLSVIAAGMPVIMALVDSIERCLAL